MYIKKQGYLGKKKCRQAANLFASCEISVLHDKWSKCWKMKVKMMMEYAFIIKYY